MGRLAFNYDSNNIIGHVESIKESNDGLAVTVSRTETKNNQKTIELTQEEIDAVLKVAGECKCKFSILRLFVHNQRRIVEPLRGIKNQNTIELTQEEIDAILGIATRCCCDTDGDILNLIVNADEMIVKPLTLLPTL